MATLSQQECDRPPVATTTRPGACRDPEDGAKGPKGAGSLKWMLVLHTMATRGRRGAVPTQDEGSTGGSQALAQQAQDQTGVPLPPPPPPVDYGALMQGLVHAMQTQAQMIAVLQAQVQVQVQAPAHEAGFARVSMMERFRRMTTPFLKGDSDPILAESWLRETEKIFHAIRCAEEERVTLATYMLQEAEIEVYLEEKRASLKRPASAFQR
ncbi:hypothetical protein Taro_048965 [Colocasia esculenta]|uniref:Uncharacterized protein n=1 Tax=Colocasia esculenta TaxID=4460 RepID=A0A843X9L8_COLES|nr:hypothetical protein [Colocasia esculenta]